MHNPFSLAAHFFGFPSASSIISCTFLFVFAVVFVELHAHIQRDKYLFKTYARGLSLLCTVKKKNIYIYIVQSFHPLLTVGSFLFSPFCCCLFTVQMCGMLLCACHSLSSHPSFCTEPPFPLFSGFWIFGPWLLSENFSIGGGHREERCGEALHSLCSLVNVLVAWSCFRSFRFPAIAIATATAPQL